MDYLNNKVFTSSITKDNELNLKTPYINCEDKFELSSNEEEDNIESQNSFDEGDIEYDDDESIDNNSESISDKIISLKKDIEYWEHFEKLNNIKFKLLLNETLTLTKISTYINNIEPELLINSELMKFINTSDLTEKIINEKIENRITSEIKHYKSILNIGVIGGCVLSSYISILVYGLTKYC